jgi:hypothetical protein
MSVMPSNRPRYIEEFWRDVPDWANNESATGDADWLPAFRRAAAEHVLAARPYQKRIFLGDTTDHYDLGGKLDLLGVHFEGLYNDVVLHFPNNTDGIHLHSPGTSLDVYPPELIGKGGPSTLININVVLNSKGVGTRGVIIQNPSVLESVRVDQAGWHGFHLTAGTDRGPSSIDGGASNANRAHLRDCSAITCGSRPGLDSRLITEANPVGHRQFGSGLKIEGKDANLCTTTSFHAVMCAGFGIDDNGFLGNLHTIPDVGGCGHTVQDWEDPADIYGVPVGSRVNLGYRMSDNSSGGLLICPYHENASPKPIIDLTPPNFVIHGVGGANQLNTKRITAGNLFGKWAVKANDGSMTTMMADAGGSAAEYMPKNDSPLRTAYFDFVDGDIANAVQSSWYAGFWRMDIGRSDRQVPLGFTGTKSYERKNTRELTRKLLPGWLTLSKFYRFYSYGLYREQLCGPANTLSAIEALFPAADKQVGDAYQCLSPVVGGVHTAVVIAEAGVKRWAATGLVQ